jgi:hypothetical protein
MTYVVHPLNEMKSLMITCCRLLHFYPNEIDCLDIRKVLGYQSCNQKL